MWYITLLSATRVGASGWQRGGLFLGLPVSIAIILSVLRHGADHEVRADPGFLFLLTFLGIVPALAFVALGSHWWNRPCVSR